MAIDIADSTERFLCITYWNTFDIANGMSYKKTKYIFDIADFTRRFLAKHIERHIQNLREWNELQSEA